MTDTITITDLALWTHIGVPAEERATEQRLFVSISMSLDTKKAAASDSEKDSIDYEHVANAIRHIAGIERKTIEKLTSDIADTVLNTFKPQSVTVTVKKHILPGTKDVALTITRP